MKAQPAQPGHLWKSGLNHKQNEQVRASLSKAQTRVEAFKRLKSEPVTLDWKTKQL